MGAFLAAAVEARVGDLVEVLSGRRGPDEVTGLRIYVVEIGLDPDDGDRIAGLGVQAETPLVYVVLRRLSVIRRAP